MSIKRWTPREDIKPYLVTALDIETASDGSVLAIGFAWETSDNERCYLACESWDEWYKAYQGIYKDADKETRFRLRYIYAHNGAGFDWLSLVIWAEDNQLMQKMEFILSGGMGIGIDVTFPKFTIKLRDSVRLMPGTLKSLCESFQTKHGKLEVPENYISHMEDFKKRYPDQFWGYLRNDVLGLQEVIKEFWTVIYKKVGSIDRLPMTLPALAMRLWRMTLDKEIMVPWGKELKALERRAYTGGRTECYMIGTYDVKVYDINSLYPSQMYSEIFPASSAGYWVHDYQGEHGIYEIEYRQTNRKVKAVLRDETSDEFRYKGSGVYTKPEIDKLLAVGGKITVHRGYVYREMAPLFQEFIKDWYGTRRMAIRRGDTGLAYVCKILMNSLYGKFGQNDVGEKLAFWTYDKIQEELEKGTQFTMNNGYVIVQEQRKSETTFVGIAAYITAYARLADYAAMERAEEMGFTVTYTDTDSQHIIGGELPTSDALGDIKEEYSGEITYLGKKLYARQDGTIKAKGIGKDARKKMTPELFKELAETGRDYVTEFTVFPSIRESIFRIRPVNRSFTRKRTIRARAPLTHDDNERIIGAD